MTIKIVENKITKEELAEIGKEFYEEMVKAVVDVEKEIIAIGGELHSDAAEVLIKNNSQSENLWGINIHFDKPKNEWIEFESLINVKPVFSNRSTKIEKPEIREKIKKIVDKLT